jgi:phosphohistidine phosphatase
MKYLTIIRHADASPATSGQSDFDRPLSLVGTAQAIAQFDQLNLSGQPILYHSAAKRTSQTAELLELRHPNILDIVARKDLYNADLEQLLEVVEELWDHQHIILVAHNPGVSQLHYHLTEDWKSFEPCSISQLYFQPGQLLENAKGEAICENFYSPQIEQ